MSTATIDMNKNDVHLQDIMSCVVNKENGNLRSLLNSFSGFIDSVFTKSQSDKTELDSFANTTPLYAAVQVGNVEAAKILLDNGANLKKVISAPNGLLMSTYELCVMSNDTELGDMVKQYAQTQGSNNEKKAVVATAVVRSSKSKTIQFGKQQDEVIKAK